MWNFRKKFSRAFALCRSTKKSEHGKLSQIQDLTVGFEPIMGDYHDQELRNGLTACQHFLTDSENVGCRQLVFKLASTKITRSFLIDKLQHVFEILPCAAKVKVAFGYIFRNVEDGKYCYFYAHEKNLIPERPQLIANKEDMLEMHNILAHLNIVELSTRDGSSTKRKFLFATNMTVFAALQKRSCWV